ncbi:hypothetical protein [Marinobacter xestospongiae]|uniref:Uncharacterized protein n=1 Tax=Marinobacter xestospongiae TaxID=994319 RepID=A0ABU3VU47_9GAMM|nr:hypothetical protein [Marinobacter xestospongiae]MDV2077794.1 hypothetical protein [Marinobacter xestospongiae]
MTKSANERIEILEEFDSLLGRQFEGKYEPEGREGLRKRINSSAPSVRSIVAKVGCMKRVSTAPPPAIGGPALQNVDPFDMIFDDYFGMSFIPTLRDMVQQAIGVIQADPDDSDTGKCEKEERIVYKQLDVPEKVTLAWLAHNVPIKLWFFGGGLLLAAFSLGLKASTWNFVREILGMVQCA